MRKSVISLLLSISMTVGSVGAVPAFAAEAAEEETAFGSTEEVAKEAVSRSTEEAAEEAASGSTEEVVEEDTDTASGKAGTVGTSEVAKEIEEASDDASTLSTSEVAKEIEEVPDEAASAAGEVTEASAEQKNASGSSFKPGDKMIALGKEGTTQQFPMNPERTKGFDDYRVDISSYEVFAYVLNEEGKVDGLERNTIQTTGEYRKLELDVERPLSGDNRVSINDDKNVIHYEIQGPNVKKVLREKAHDEEVFFGPYEGCLSEPLGVEEFMFDEVNSERITRRLHLPDSELMTTMHIDIEFGLEDYELDELRKYDSVREFVGATNFLQSDDIYKETIGTERSNKITKTFIEDFNGDIDAYARDTAEKHYANGYERTVETVYASCLGIKEDSEWLDEFKKKYDDNTFSFCVKEGDTYWFAMWPYYDFELAEYQCPKIVKYFVDNYFPDIQESEYEVRPAAAFDEWNYNVYYDFTEKDLCDAWLAEMENWEGHWINFLYGVHDRADIGKEGAVPGYGRGNWIFPGNIYGKTTLHYPDQYDYYVKDPGVYTVTATIDGCKGVITDQFVVKVKPGWVKDDKGWKYIEETGKPAKNKWIDEYYNQFYVKDDGYMATGWQKIDNAWYYFDADGIMQRGWRTIGNARYHFSMDGIMQTGWQKVNNKWYYLSAGGAMQTGWQKIGKVWYYFNTDGVMQTGWQKIGSSWYYFGTGGAMQTGWQKINNKWYYMSAGGAMAKDRKQLVLLQHRRSDADRLAEDQQQMVLFQVRRGDGHRTPADRRQMVYIQQRRGAAVRKIYVLCENHKNSHFRIFGAPVYSILLSIVILSRRKEVGCYDRNI